MSGVARRVAWSAAMLSMLAVVVLPQLRAAEDAPAIQLESHVYQGDGDFQLPYRLFQPDEKAPPRGFPLVLYLHGAGQRGDDNQRHVKDNPALAMLLGADQQKNFPCVVVAPQCPADTKWTGTNWQSEQPKQTTEIAPPLAAVEKLLDALEKQLPIDNRRVYVTGVSMGGSGTWDLAARFPMRFAAAVPVCGGVDPAMAPALKNLPIWAFQGERDEVVNAEMPRQTLAAVKRLADAENLRLKYTELPSAGHNIAGQVYKNPELWAWLFSHERSR